MTQTLIQMAGSYSARMQDVLANADWEHIQPLADELLSAWRERRQVFIMGNGGSGGNANHIVNDYLYPVSKIMGEGIRMRSLAENPSTITCIANDEGYEHIFSTQLGVLANKGDCVIALSGSGNSPNILKALEVAKDLGVTSYAILGFEGGKAKQLADHAIHFPVDDMQIAEDLQMIVMNMIMQYLYQFRIEFGAS